MGAIGVEKQRVGGKISFSEMGEGGVIFGPKYRPLLHGCGAGTGTGRNRIHLGFPEPEM